MELFRQRVDCLPEAVKQNWIQSYLEKETRINIEQQEENRRITSEVCRRGIAHSGAHTALKTDLAYKFVQKMYETCACELIESCNHFHIHPTFDALFTPYNEVVDKAIKRQLSNLEREYRGNQAMSNTVTSTLNNFDIQVRVRSINYARPLFRRYVENQKATEKEKLFTYIGTFLIWLGGILSKNIFDWIKALFHH